MKNDNGTITITEVLNLNQAAEYVSLSKSAIYKKTSERNIPHFKQGKKLYFKRSELDDWLTGMKISTKAEIEKEATDYIIRKGKFRFWSRLITVVYRNEFSFGKINGNQFSQMTVLLKYTAAINIETIAILA